MKKWFLAILALHLFILTKITFFPNSELFIYPYLTNQGLLPYKQILDQHFPGLLFLPINFDNLGMTTPTAALVWQLGAVAITQYLIYILAKRVIKSPGYILLPNVLYLIWQPFFEGFIQWLDIFLPIFLLSAALLVLKYFDKPKKELYIEAAGFVLGLGIIFKQVLVPVVALILLYLLLKRGIKVALLFGLSALLPILVMLIYLSVRGVLGDFIYWTVTYNMTVFAEYGRKWIPSFSHLIRFAFVFGVGFFVLLAYFRERKIFLLGLFGFGSLAAVFARFDFIHLQPALPFVVLLTGFGLSAFPKSHLLRVGVLVYLLLAVFWGIKFYNGNLGGGVTFFDDNVYNVANEVRSSTKRGDKIFVYGAPAHLYQMTGTIPAGDVFIFQFPWFMRVAQKRVLDGLILDKPRLVVAQRSVYVDGQAIVNYASEINEYLSRFYYTDERIGDYEILKLR